MWRSTNLKSHISLVWEIQSGWEEVHQANAHTAEVALAQLAGRKQECIVAIITMKNRTAMIFLDKVVGSPEQSFQKVSFKPVCLDWYNLKVAAA